MQKETNDPFVSDIEGVVHEVEHYEASVQSRSLRMKGRLLPVSK